MPGVSRSGITITAGRFLRLDRDSAARFSFLLLVPAVLGAVVWKGVGDVLLGDLPDGWQGPFVVGTLAAAGSGLLAIHGLLGYVRRHNYSVFVVYRLITALVIVLLIASGAYEASF
jgi:undecaprenyl-diphosphatase